MTSKKKGKKRKTTNKNKMKNKPLNKIHLIGCDTTVNSPKSLPSLTRKTPSPLTECRYFSSKFSSLGKTFTDLPLRGPHFLTILKRLRKISEGMY